MGMVKDKKTQEVANNYKNRCMGVLVCRLNTCKKVSATARALNIVTSDVIEMAMEALYRELEQKENRRI